MICLRCRLNVNTINRLLSGITMSHLHKLYLDNLAHTLDHNYHWRDGETIDVRLVTINTGTMIQPLTDLIAEHWAGLWRQFLTELDRLVVGRDQTRSSLTRTQRHFLSAGLPVLERADTGRAHIHMLVWEQQGQSVFASPDSRVRRRVLALAKKVLNATNIDLDKPTTLLTVDQGVPKFTWDGQLSVLKATRYLRGKSSRRLYELFVDDTARNKRKNRLISQQLVEQAEGRSLLATADSLSLDQAVQITELDDCSMMVKVTATRLRTPYRRQQVLDRLLDELDLHGLTFDFDNPVFVANFDPGRRLETARLLAVHGATSDQQFDPRRWCDKPGVFSTLYMNRNRLCLRPLRQQIELMDTRLFGQTYASAEQLMMPARIWWSKGVSYAADES